MRYGYLKRLITGTRERINTSMNEHHTEMREEYPECVSAGWVDASLLCSVVEHDVIDNQIADQKLDRLIVAVNSVREYLAENTISDDVINSMGEVINILTNLKDA